MRSTGMAEISDPSTLFITGADLPGCAVTCAMEGTRPMMVEVQALLSKWAEDRKRYDALADGIREIIQKLETDEA